MQEEMSESFGTVSYRLTDEIIAANGNKAHWVWEVWNCCILGDSNVAWTD